MDYIKYSRWLLKALVEKYGIKIMPLRGLVWVPPRCCGLALAATLVHRDGSTRAPLVCTLTKPIITIPVELKVWNFTVPNESTINIDSNIWADKIKNFVKGDYSDTSTRLEVLKPYYKSVFEHRAKSGQLTSIPVKLSDGHAITDTSDFEKHFAFLKTIGDCKNLRLYNVLNVTGQNEPHQWPTNSKWQNIPLFLDTQNTKLNPVFVAPFGEHVSQIMAALKRQGCYGNPYIKFFDEPDITHQPTISAITNIAKLIKEMDPNIYPACSGAPHIDFMDYFGRWDFPSGGNIPFYKKELSHAREKTQHGFMIIPFH